MSENLTDSAEIQATAKPEGAKTLAEDAYNRIRQSILTGELGAGEKLRLEALSKRYDVGMGPLREALSRLTGQSLVVTEGQRGFWVAPLSLKEFDDLTRVRLLVESEALYASIARGDAAWEERVKNSFEVLSEVEDRIARNAGSASEFEEANRLFHEAIVANCDSPWLLRLVGMLYQQSERYRRFALIRTNQIRSVHDEHEALVTAVLTRNGLRACRVLELHLQGTANVVREALSTQRPS